MIEFERTSTRGIKYTTMTLKQNESYSGWKRKCCCLLWIIFSIEEHLVLAIQKCIFVRTTNVTLVVEKALVLIFWCVLYTTVFFCRARLECFTSHGRWMLCFYACVDRIFTPHNLSPKTKKIHFRPMAYSKKEDWLLLISSGCQTQQYR